MPDPAVPSRASARALRTAVVLLSLLAATAPLHAADDWFVSAGADGGGSAGDPFGTIQAALKVAQPGDQILVLPGTYRESLATVRGGIDGAPIVVRAAQGRGSVLVTASGRVLTVSHPYVVIESLVLDGQYGSSDAVKVASAAAAFTLRNSEVRRAGRDCVDMVAPVNVLLEQSSIHHCLWWNGGRVDAHAVVAGAVRNLVLRDMDIHTFSGDGLQLDPGRSLPGWDDVLVERTTFRLAPLPAAENGFPAGVVPGENAIDTKTNPKAPRAHLTIVDSSADGFGPGLISNMAAFNLKEQVHATVDRVTVLRSEIAFRLRGPGSNGGAWVDLRNVVVHDVGTAIRYEDDIEHLTLAYSTIGRNVGRALRAASSGWSGVDVQHTLFSGSALPTEAPASGGNFAAPDSWFIAAGAHDYRLQAAVPALDSARTGIAAPPTDRDGQPRPQGNAADAGAYERAAAAAPAKPATPTGFQAVALLGGSTVTVKLTWTAASSVETEYQLSRSTDGKKFSQIATIAAGTTLYSDTAVHRTTKYWYRLRAANNVGRSSNAKTTVVTP